MFDKIRIKAEQYVDECIAVGGMRISVQRRKQLVENVDQYTRALLKSQEIDQKDACVTGPSRIRPISVSVPSGVGCQRCGCKPRAVNDNYCSFCRDETSEEVKI